MKNDKSRRSPDERRSTGARRDMKGSTGQSGRSRERGSSSGSVWRIDRDDQAEGKGAERDASTQGGSKPAFYERFEKPTRSTEERGSSDRRKDDGRGDERRRDERRRDERRGDDRGDRNKSNSPAERKQFGRPKRTDNDERRPIKRADTREPLERGKRVLKRSESSDDKRSYGSKERGERFDKSRDSNRPIARDSNRRYDDRSSDRYSRGTSRNNADDARNTGGKRKRMDKAPDDGLIRLNKFIANSGVCSRREADDYIVAGVITVNGAVISELGARVNPNDDIRFNGERLKGEKKVYVLLNKPKNYVTTVEDPHADRTVMNLVDQICSERIYPVGRLDRNTTGVLLFTNDGELTKQLTHPSYNKLKVYHVFLDKSVTQRDMRTLVEGINLEDGIAAADAVDYVGEKKSEVGLEIHSGRNRVVRRMFEALGYEVVKLDRVFFAGLTKKNLRRGECRLLTDKEVDMLKMGAYE